MRAALLAAAAALTAACATSGGGQAGAPRDIRIAGQGVFPESITSDAAGNIYVGSMTGTIYRAAPGSQTAQAWVTPDAANGLQSLFGVLADDRHQLLWTCSNPNSFNPPEPPAAGANPAGSAMVAFALGSGAHRGTYPFPAGPAACNDMAVAADDTVFVTDTAQGRIFSLAEGTRSLVLFASGQDLIGIDGIAFADDGRMYINNVRTNKVQRVNRSASGAYEGLTDLVLSEPVQGPDGLRAVGGNKFLQAEGGGGRVAVIEVQGNRAQVTPVRTGLDSSPGVTRVGRVGYATEGKIQYLVDPELRGQDPGDFYIRAFALPEGL
jgi:DNA-binding beta-propeller fold protein YncE